MLIGETSYQSLMRRAAVRAGPTTSALTAGQLPGMPTSVSSTVVTGDSITGAPEIPANSRWANIVTTALGSTLNNNGISGTVLQNSPDASNFARANNLRDRYVADLTGVNKKNLVVIAYGLNDARYTAAPQSFNKANFINDYREILYGLQAAGYTGNRIVLVSPHWFPDEGFASGGAGFTGQNRVTYETYVAAVLALAKEFGCYYADSYTALKAAGPSVFGPDKIHPLDTCQAIIAQAVLAAKLQIQGAYSYDSFTASDGVRINERSGEAGAGWSLAVGYPANAAPLVTANRIYNDALSAVWRSTGLAASADYEIVSLWRCMSSIASGNTAIFLRNNPNGLDRLYWGGHFEGTSRGWRLMKTVDGVSTQLGSFVGPTALTAGQWYRVVIRTVGTTISLIVDGTTLVTATDSAVTAAGYGGVRMATICTSSTGVHIEDILVRPVPTIAA